MLSRLLLAAGLVVGLSPAIPAQAAKGGQQPPIQFTEDKEIQGTIDAMIPGRMRVTDSTTTLSVNVWIPPNSRVHVTGKAKAEYLRPGMLVEFKGDLDDHGALKDKVAEVTVVSDKRPGIFSADEAGAGGDFGGAPKPAKRTGGKVPAGTYNIVSRLAGAGGGKFSVKVGRSVVELADEPAVKVDLIDYTVASKGDKVTIKGMKASGQDLIRADELKIELAEPLAGTGMKKKGAAGKSDSKRPPKRPKKEAGGLPEPAADK